MCARSRREIYNFLRGKPPHSRVKDAYLQKPLVRPMSVFLQVRRGARARVSCSMSWSPTSRVQSLAWGHCAHPHSKSPNARKRRASVRAATKGSHLLYAKEARPCAPGTRTFENIESTQRPRPRRPVTTRCDPEVLASAAGTSPEKAIPVWCAPRTCVFCWTRRCTRSLRDSMFLDVWNPRSTLGLAV